MILENGIIRTLDPTLPVARALAVAGERIVGGVGTHERELAGPERVDLGGRCVLPGFTDSHVHFMQWAIAQRQVRLEGTANLDEAVARVADAAASAAGGGWIRGTGWRSGDWSPAVEPTKHALDPVTGDVPVALMAKDGHSLWLNSAALARADGSLAVPGGVVETDERGEPTGVLREESAWQFRERCVYGETPPGEWLDAMRAGLRLASSRGVTALHDKDGWLGALGLFQRLRDEGNLTVRVWQSLPHAQLDALTDVGLMSGLGDDLLRVGYIKAFLDGTLGSGTALLLDGGGVQITGYDEFEEIVRRSARAGFPVAVHAIGDLANRRALDAFEATRDEWRPRCSSATRPPTATSPTASGKGRPRARMPSGRCSRAAPSSPTAPTHPSRSSTRCSASARASSVASTTASPGTGSRPSPSTRRCTPPASRPPGWPATSAAA